MRSQNHTTIAEEAVRSVTEYQQCYERSISEIEDLDHRIGRIEVERATTGRARLHRNEMQKLQSLRLSAVQDRDHYNGCLQKIQDLAQWLELEDQLMTPGRY
jgi:hypothetical protein